MNDFSEIKALTFDVFGTVVDWRGSIIDEGKVWGKRMGIAIDWAAFADAWRGGYEPAMARVNGGQLPWTNIDGLHRMILDEIVDSFGIALDDEAREEWNRVWHRVQPWADSVAGIERMRRRFVVASLSNGNMALLVNMARHAGFAWDCVLSAELFRRYKTDRAVYEGAAGLLGLQPEQVLMVAAHNHDLAGARRAGMRTAFVLRAEEYGPQQSEDLAAEAWVDLAVEDFAELADCLGC